MEVQKNHQAFCRESELSNIQPSPGIPTLSEHLLLLRSCLRMSAVCSVLYCLLSTAFNSIESHQSGSISLIKIGLDLVDPETFVPCLHQRQNKYLKFYQINWNELCCGLLWKVFWEQMTREIPWVSWKDPLDPRSLRFLWIRFLRTTFFLSGGSNKICNVFQDSQPTLSPSLAFACHALDDGAQVPVDSLAVGVCSLSLSVPCTQKKHK